MLSQFHFLPLQQGVSDSGQKVAYLRHKVGVNSTKMVKTSKRPSSIAAEHTQV